MFIQEMIGFHPHLLVPVIPAAALLDVIPAQAGIQWKHSVSYKAHRLAALFFALFVNSDILKMIG